MCVYMNIYLYIYISIHMLIYIPACSLSGNARLATIVRTCLRRLTQCASSSTVDRSTLASRAQVQPCMNKP